MVMMQSRGGLVPSPTSVIAAMAATVERTHTEVSVDELQEAFDLLLAQCGLAVVLWLAGEGGDKLGAWLADHPDPSDRALVDEVVRIIPYDVEAATRAHIERVGRLPKLHRGERP